LIEQRNYEQAIPLLDNAIKADPEYALPYYYRGIANDHTGNKDQAIIDLTKAIELDSEQEIKLDESYFYRGAVYTHLKEYQKAISDFTRAIELGGTIIETSRYYAYRGLAYAYSKEFEKGLEDCNTAVGTGYDPNAYLFRGYMYSEWNRYELAIDDYTEVIAFIQSFSENAQALGACDYFYPAYTGRGQAYFEMGEMSKALDDLDNAVIYNSGQVTPLIFRGDVYTALGEYEKALADCNQAIEMKPDYAKSYFHRGLTYAETGDTDKAIEDLEKCIELSDDSELTAEAKIKISIIGKAAN
jgi:tetratricopeptide (TPR) repeat protein